MISLFRKKSFSPLVWCLTFLLSSSLFMSSAFAFNRIDAIKAMQSVNGNWTDTDVEIWINNLKGDPDPGVMVGDNMKFSVQSRAPGYFLFALVDAKGETTLITTEPGEPATSLLVFPEQGGEDVLEQGPPLGEQTIFAFASDTAFPLTELGMAGSVDTLGKDRSSLDNFASTLNRIAATGKIAVAPRYSYFVDSPENTISTRGLKRVLRKQMVEMEQPEVAVAATTAPSPAPAPAPAPTVVAAATIVAETPATATPAPAAPKMAEPEPEPEMVGVATADASSALSLDIKFQYNSAELGEEGITQLDVIGSALISLLEADLLPRISLEGHTDNAGSEEYNLSLSDKRAKAARAYLVNTFGLPGNNIEAYGMGEVSPMVDNKTKASRALNRRVEMRVLR